MTTKNTFESEIHHHGTSDITTFYVSGGTRYNIEDQLYEYQYNRLGDGGYDTNGTYSQTTYGDMDIDSQVLPYDEEICDWYYNHDGEFSNPDGWYEYTTKTQPANPLTCTGQDVTQGKMEGAGT